MSGPVAKQPEVGRVHAGVQGQKVATHHVDHHHVARVIHHDTGPTAVEKPVHLHEDTACELSLVRRTRPTGGKWTRGRGGGGNKCTMGPDFSPTRLRLWASLASETWASSSRTKVDKKVSTTSDSWSDEYSYSALPWEHAETCGKGSV